MSDEPIRPGYKRTEVGMIPEDWDLKPLGDIGTFSKGRGISKRDLVNDGLPCIRYGEIYTHHHDFVREFFSFITPEVAAESQRLHKGDLLFTGSGETAEEIGKCVAFLGEMEAYAGGDIVIFTPAGHNSLYLGYLLNHTSIISQRIRMAQGHTVVHISAHHLAQLQLPLPRFSEQHAIAEVLSDVDALLDALDRLIAKKRAIKQGAMQALLTGRVRLPGFTRKPSYKRTELGVIPEDWEVYKLSELERQKWVSLGRGKVISKRDMAKNPGHYPIYSSSVTNEGLFGHYGEYMFDEELVTWSIDGGGNFFFRPKHKYSVTNVCGFMRVNSQQVKLRFLVFQLQILHSRMKFDYLLKAHPSVIRNVYSIPLPSPAEQRAIAEVLSDMDAEIEALEKRRAKLRDMKQGMMQELLTGRIRLVQPQEQEVHV